MAEQAIEVGAENLSVNTPESGPPDEDNEPKTKKMKFEPACSESDSKLEDRLNGILRCTVCLDLPRVSMYQCTNGHLMCAGCFAHLLADARLNDETSTCPNCRCEISKNLCSRNLAAEKAVSELPAECRFCSDQLPRHMLENHEGEKCLERLTNCEYDKIGCPWRGPYHELKQHAEQCTHPKKTGAEIMESLNVRDLKRAEEMKVYNKIHSMLSYEKITFVDLQLRPYRTDDFITKLFYETSRFSAFNWQWVIKARVNDDMKNPALSTKRSLTYQLILKSRVANPFDVHYLIVQGPYGEMNVMPAIYKSRFSNENFESDYEPLPIGDSLECNKLLAAKTINLRLIMFQIQS